MPIVRLEKATLSSRYGGKASALAQLMAAGFPIPDGFVVHIEPHESINSYKQEILRSFDELGSPHVAVRSSAAAEDGEQASWAGQLATFLQVDRAGLIETIQQCRHSAKSKRALAYADQQHQKAGIISVLVQTMVESDTSGVAFSVHPIFPTKQRLVIESVFGLGEALVSGEVTPDNYTIDKTNLDLIEYTPGAQVKKLVPSPKGGIRWEEVAARQVLSAVQLEELSHTVMELEKYFGHPIDVEWAYCQKKLYILQARPITTLT